MMKVLVVDDSALMRKAITMMLLESGEFTVETARNGEDALAAIPRVRPDVVTLDINMPVMDGLTCLATIMREFPCPVVVVSSLTERAALITLEALELGATDYVPKPGGTVSLNMAEVRDELVSKVRQAACLRGQPGGLVSRLRRQREVTRVERAHRTAVPPSHRGGMAVSGADLVLIGASTGGPALLATLLSQLPKDFRAAVVVAQHMPASFTGAMAQRLDEHCQMPVYEVTRPMAIRPGRIYLARGDGDLVLCQRSEGLTGRPVPANGAYRWHPSVDRLVASAIEVVEPSRTVGVLLTGMGDDGAEQMALLHELGGRTIAESEESAVVWGMPGQLVARGGASTVLDADRIADHVLTWV